MDVTVTPDLPDELRSAYENASRVPLGLGILAFLFLFALGVFCLLKPELVWQFQHLWTVKGGEPTDYYLVSTRIAGGICIFGGVFCLAAAF